MKNNRLYTPEGVRDYLPEELIRKNRAHQALERVFESFGYNRASSPTLEYADVFEVTGGTAGGNMYKLIDRDGAILTLRSDLTPAMARIAATNYSEKSFPLRLSYFENAFRYNENYQGKEKEFTQAGVELIGYSDTDADAEIVALSVFTLDAAGLENYRIDVSDVGFLHGIIKETGLDENDMQILQKYIIDTEYTAVEAFIKQKNVPPGIEELLRKLPFLIGGSELLDEAEKLTSSPEAKKGIARIRRLYEILRDYGVSERVTVDLGLTGHLDYYTGLIMRGYAPGAGFRILDGGRYDQLMAKFGLTAPAVGFAIEMNVLLEALTQNQTERERLCPETLIAYTEKGRPDALGVCAKFRAEGLRVEAHPFPEESAAVAYSAERGHGGVLFFCGGNAAVINMKTGDRKSASIEELKK